MIYLDNNATTLMPPTVLKALSDWCNRGNPSAGYASAMASKAMMEAFRKHIADVCGVTPASGEQSCGERDYRVIFTSGASEANCTIVHGAVTAWSTVHKGTVPHLVMSAIEHRSLLDLGQDLEARGMATVTLVPPSTSGHVHPDDVARALRSNTCLVCIMHANNETGAINDVRAIGAICHSRSVPFYCDTSQTFGKYPMSPVESNVDAFCISFHKLHGPPGVGALIVKGLFLEGYHMPPLIFGSQNDGHRGGTENLPGIGASFAAVKHSLNQRSLKNQRMLSLKRYIMTELSARIPTRKYTEYLVSGKGGRQPEVEIIYLSGASDNGNQSYLPNTLLLSVVKRTEPYVCNGGIKSALERKKIVVSVGSACNTASPKASHVLYAMGADELIRKGALRISIGDDTTKDDVSVFVKEFLMIVSNLTKPIGYRKERGN